MARCTAKAKHSGVQCKNDAMIGSTKCRVHGGKTPRGFASPHTKTGRYSKDLPTRMAAQYQESLADTELLNLRDDISLLDARINDVLKRVDTGESGRLWGLLMDAHDALHDARLRDDKPRMTMHLNEISMLIKRGMGDYAAWGEIGRLLEQRRRLVDSEAKRLKDMQMMYTAEQGMMLMAQVVALLTEHVTDRKALDAIQRGLAALIGDPADVIDVA